MENALDAWMLREYTISRGLVAGIDNYMGSLIGWHYLEQAGKRRELILASAPKFESPRRVFQMDELPLVIGVDVGTGSVRAGLFDSQGHRLATASHPILMWNPRAGYAEQSSEDIWKAVGAVVRVCLGEARVGPRRIAGISFDATCSMVVVDAAGRGLPVHSETGEVRDVLVWMDQRAAAEAQEITATGAAVLDFLGGKMSPEMQTPKLLWIKRHLPETWGKAAQFFDLADWLTWRASGNLSRSSCCLVCKWTYLGHERSGQGRWDDGYFRELGIESALGKIGSKVQAMGTGLGPLTVRGAEELGLSLGCIVAQGMIDAHAGGVGALAGVGLFESTLALIGGTSNCHMATSREPRNVPGVWGPYFGAMLPGLWLNEGGQTTAGLAIDETIANHALSETLRQAAASRSQSVYEILNAELQSLGGSPVLTKDVHVLPDLLGNRSPRADAAVRGLFDGLTVDRKLSGLAVRYLATIQAVAYGSCDIIAALRGSGYRIERIVATGGATKNPVWLQEHADAMGLPIALPAESESVLLGTAMLAAAGAGIHADLPGAMRAMGRAGQVIMPRPEWRSYHDAKLEIFRSLYDQQSERREKMSRFG